MTRSGAYEHRHAPQIGSATQRGQTGQRRRHTLLHDPTVVSVEILSMKLVSDAAISGRNAMVGGKSWMLGLGAGGRRVQRGMPVAGTRKVPRILRVSAAGLYLYSIRLCI
jgi:hypothetical protein